VDCSKIITAPKAELSILLTNDSEIRALNKQYRGKDYATDVLSFSLLEGSNPVIEEPIMLIGDIVISLEKMLQQADEYKVNPYQELLRLLIHGILHLLGYDHENVPESVAETMRNLEEQIYISLLPQAERLIR